MNCWALIYSRVFRNVSRAHFLLSLGTCSLRSFFPKNGMRGPLSSNDVIIWFFFHVMINNKGIHSNSSLNAYCTISIGTTEEFSLKTHWGLEEFQAKLDTSLTLVPTGMVLPQAQQHILSAVALANNQFLTNPPIISQAASLAGSKNFTTLLESYFDLLFWFLNIKLVWNFNSLNS